MTVKDRSGMLPVAHVAEETCPSFLYDLESLEVYLQ